jgi:hypothetical protein
MDRLEQSAQSIVAHLRDLIHRRPRRPRIAPQEIRAVPIPPVTQQLLC